MRRISMKFLTLVLLAFVNISGETWPTFEQLCEVQDIWAWLFWPLLSAVLTTQLTEL